MRDTAELSPMLTYIKENFMSKTDIIRIFRSFGSIPSMFPKGGDNVWGTANDETPDQITLGYMLTFLRSELNSKMNKDFEKVFFQIIERNFVEIFRSRKKKNLIYKI